MNVLVLQEGFYIVTNPKWLVVQKTDLNLLVCFNFCFIVLGSSERFDSHVSLPSFLSICGITLLIICFDLKFKGTLIQI